MITSTHLFIGAAIGKATGNIYIAIPLAFASHYLLDAIPHHNPGPVKFYLEKGLRGADKKNLLFKSIEPIIGIGIIAYAAHAQSELSLVLILGALFGWLPDFLVFLHWKHNSNLGIIRKIEKSYHKHSPFLVWIITQAIIIVLALIYIFN